MLLNLTTIGRAWPLRGVTTPPSNNGEHRVLTVSEHQDRVQP